MKRVTNRVFLIFTLIMIMSWVLPGIKVYGGTDMVLLNDTGSSPGSWSITDNKVASVSSLENGPSRGNPGSFYYFTTSSGSRELSGAVISRVITLNTDQKTLGSLGQLKVNFSLDYFGWEDDDGDDDRFAVSIYSVKEAGNRSLIYSSSYYSGYKSWKTFNMPEKILPKDTIKIQVVITVDRQSGDDLDVYLDNIKLSVYDDNLPVMTGATVTEIRDWQNNLVPLKKDLDNWVNTSDTIYGQIEFNEPVTIPTDINTNILDEYDRMVHADTGNSPESFLTSHEYSIPLTYKDRSIEVDGTINFLYGPDESGPFDFPVHDLGGNQGQSSMMPDPDIGDYNIKLDSAPPTITTPWDSYKEYIPGRTSVDVVVNEENRGSEQSPLTLTYFWEYTNSSNLIVREPEKQILISSMVEPVVDEINTTYTVKIDIPNGSTIPPYQDFWLSAEVDDEARNMYGNNIIYSKVNQKDVTPPDITWDKSIHEDGTEVNLNVEEDTLYTKSRTVSFSANDLESGVEEVKYLWTKEPYNADTDRISKLVLPGEDGKYEVQGTSLNTPIEGLYYLNLLAINNTGASVVTSEGFYFDNEGPRVSGGVIYTDGNPTSAQLQVRDRVLQNKFLYTLLASDSDSYIFEPATEPNISEGIKDDGMWRVLELEGVGEERTANIIGVLDKITQSGYYKLVTRYYDEYYNYTEVEEVMGYDFTPPSIEVVDVEESDIFQQNHDVVIKVLGGDVISINWIDVDSGEEIPASFNIEPQYQLINIKSSDDLNGKYYLEVKATDGSNNNMEETVLVDGSRAEFSFDNSPPSINLVYDAEKAVRKVRFSYSELKDTYTDVVLFKYGISDTPDGEPSEWKVIDSASSFGEIIYPKEFATDGEWYLSVLLRDTLGNEQIIRQESPFHIDLTNPTGKVSFERGFTNSLDAPIHLEVDELKSKDRAILKTILSGDKTLLEDGKLPDAQSTDWKDITYEKGIAVYNWKLSDAIDGEQRVYARFMDEVGNLSVIYEASIILDRTAPTGEITYDITAPTTGNVTANLTMTDNYNVALLNNKQVNSYVFTRNGEFEFILTDKAGNKTRLKAAVNNIDKTPPEAVITYSHPRDIWTNESIAATLKLVDINGYNVTSEGGGTHTFVENGEFVFLFKDTLGNQGSIKAEVKNIDKEALVGSIIYAVSDTAPVTVYLAVDEPVKVTNNDGSFRYIFNDNGTFKYTFEDKAGNIGEATAVIGTITSPEKYLDVIYSDSGRLTNKNIDVKFATSDLVTITIPTVTEEVDQYTYSFTENGDWSVSLRILSGVEEGKIRTVVASVQNIDRVSPQAEVYITTEEPTNQNVTATLLTYDDRGSTVTIENNGGKSEYIFEENGDFTFEFMDEAGNIGQKTIAVTNIDKSAPEAEITYSTDETKENSVFAEVSFPSGAEEMTILNNNGSNIFEFVENGAFTFQYADKAGNSGEATAQVDNLSDSVSAGTIQYYIGESEIADPSVGNTNESVTAKLFINEDYVIVNNGGSSNYTFEQNGEFTFVYEDSNKNRGFLTAKVSIIDKEAPKLQILADIVRATNKDVTITVSYSDNKEISKVMLSGEAVGTTPEGKFTYVCAENKTIQVSVSDTAGNVTTKELDVNYIDKEMPIGTIVYAPNIVTNQDVKAVLTLNEPGLILNNSGRMEYVFTENGVFIFEFEDNVGNKTTKEAYVDWIDKIPPEVSLEYSTTSMTNKSVEVTLKTEENTVILNNGGAAKRTFYTNGDFTFRVMDLAGNEVSIKAEIGNIDAKKPQITLNGLSYVSLFQDEAYTEPGYSAVDNVDGDMTSKVVVEGSVNTEVPGAYILKYKVSDAVGNRGEESRTVKVIGHDEIVLLLNDEVSEGKSVILYDSNVKVSGIGNEGSYITKWAEGKRTQAYFKTGGNNIAAEGTVKLETESWYTFFIQDRERKTKSIQVYINE